MVRESRFREWRRLSQPTREAMARWGLDPGRALKRSLGLRWIRRDFREFLKQAQLNDGGASFHVRLSLPMYEERNSPAGTTSGMYFHHDLLAAAEIFRRSPRRHIDIGSSVLGFVSHVASFREVEVIDVRPAVTRVHSISFSQADLSTDDLTGIGLTDSLSCLNALEHFGLGRYGDRIDFNGWKEALRRMRLLLEPGGTLYLAVPIGTPQRVEFNAHRVFSWPWLRDHLEEQFVVEQVYVIDDQGDLIVDAKAYGDAADASYGLSFGCVLVFLRPK